MPKLIVGCGYLGMRVAHRWRAVGETVYAVTRFPERAEGLRAAGLVPVVADVTAPTSLRELPAAETVLYAVGYDRTAGRAQREVYVAGLCNVLERLASATRRIVYISSTSVYGQTGGEWVDEASACEPAGESGRVCREAEQLLQAHRLGAQAILLRLAGIYGPGRIPRRQALVAGEPIMAPREGWLNLIHVDDAARVVLAAERCAQPPRTYTVSDGQPSLRHAYYAELARLLQAPPPVFADPAPDSPAALRAESSKRVSNRRMLAELGVTLQYPSYREGLAAIVASVEA